MGSGGFAKVYLVRQKNKTAPIKDELDVMCQSSDNLNSSSRDREFAAKMQGFTGGPTLNRREASILKRLVNPKV